MHYVDNANQLYTITMACTIHYTKVLLAPNQLFKLKDFWTVSRSFNKGSKSITFLHIPGKTDQNFTIKLKQFLRIVYKLIITYNHSKQLFKTS